jgi:hypothetical protein
MATATDKPHGSHAIQVTDMPPLHVTTDGIPAHEHLTARPRHVRDGRAGQRRSNRITWTIAGLVVILFLGATAVLQVMAPASVHLGLSSWAWSQYRSGERVATSMEVTLPVTPNSPFTGPPMTALPPLGPIEPPYVG